MTAYLDPGPVPAVVEPEPVEQVLLVDSHIQLGVTANVDHTGLTGLTIRRGQVEAAVALHALQVDELLRLLGARVPTVEQVHQVLTRHEVDVAWFRRRDGYSWWCSCLTDGDDTHPNAAQAWQSAAGHQAEAIVNTLTEPEVGR